MNTEVYLLPMTVEMYHEYFKEYQNDLDLYSNKNAYTPYVYEEEKVNLYIQRQIDLGRKALAVMVNDEIVGEIIIKNIEEHKCATLGIAMKNSKYKDRGFGTKAEQLAIEYVFNDLDIPVLYADSILSNKRSQHVLEKVGFKFLKEEGEFRYYCIERNMITIQEIPTEKAEDFWNAHMKYLLEDEIISDKEDIEYFSGDEYRTVLIGHMERETDKHHMVYFVRENEKIGAAQYNTYQSEDGKCFILDFWVFPEYRGNGTGHACFEALEGYTRSDGALYYELNSEKEDSIRFWKSLGFVENGVDEWNMKVFVRK